MPPDLADRPLVFLDVDGPLIPFKARRIGRRRSLDSAAAQPKEGTGNPLVDRLDPDDGRRLLALRCQLVWATTWMAEANEVVSPRLGLPDLPVVDWPDDDEAPTPRLHWKTVFLTQWAAGRPFVWIDDETTDADRRWVETHHPAPALLHRVDPYRGLTDADFSAIRRWLAQDGVRSDGADVNR
ncbi:HAD domain-containing protein [Micromonospora sp. WMMD729]|uniref:HAD domain-containing protein n=1 Tax=Micromonospora sp. WMMD729 TaxID=3404127 RepID=UPI003BF5A236